jgi:hypothetical protein
MKYNNVLTDGNKWLISPAENNLTGYEEHHDDFKNKYTQENYMESSEEVQNQMIDEVFNIYRSKNIFPIRYFREKADQLKQIYKCINYNPHFTVNGENILVKSGAGVGTDICHYLFPNLFEAENINNNKGKESAMKRFLDDDTLRTACRFGMQFCEDAMPTNVMAGLRMSGAMPSNFRPMNAQLIYNRYTPKNGIIYDYAMGFGGRMLGAVTSYKNFTYIGTDPDTVTFGNLCKLRDLLKVAKKDANIYIQNKCSEDLIIPDKKIDFAFSSPPYFELEKYNDEKTQSYLKFNNIDLWLEKYIKPTFQNIYNALKDDTYFAFNVADYKRKSKVVHYVEKMKQIAENIGFVFYENLKLSLPKRTGTKKPETNDKQEGIFVFRKGRPEKPYVEVFFQETLF